MADDSFQIYRTSTDTTSSSVALSPVFVRHYSVMERFRKIDECSRVVSIGRFLIAAQIFNQFFGFCLEESERQHSLMMRIASHINPKRHLIEVIERIPRVYHYSLRTNPISA